MGGLSSVLLGLSILAGAPPAAAPSLPEGPAHLRELLIDGHDPVQQAQAALALVLARGPEAVEVVRQGLRQTDSAEVFVALAAALRQNHDGRFNEELLAGLVAGRAIVRHAAAETLAAVTDTETLQRLRAIAEDTRAEPTTRQEALWALGRSGRKAAAVVLLEQLGKPEEAIRRSAADALADLSGLNLGTDPARWRQWWLAQADQPNERWLEDRLTYQTSKARRLEAELERAHVQMLQLHQQLYGHLPAPDRLGYVLTLADRDEPAIRLQAVRWGLELLPQVDAVGQRALAELMLRMSRDGTPTVQQAAVLGLGRALDARAYERLRYLLGNGQAPVRAAAAHALTEQARLRAASTVVLPVDTRTGPDDASEAMREVVPLLQKALDDPALEVVVAAAEDLGALGLPEAGPVLASLLKHPSESVRQTAAQALQHVSDPKVLEGLMAALEDPSVSVRFGLVGALGRIAVDIQGAQDKGPECARMLIRLEELALRDTDAGVRSRAATVLGQAGGAAEVAFLWRRVTSREDSRVQEKAWSAMVEILARTGSQELVTQWSATLAEANQPARRTQLLAEIVERWRKTEALRPQALALAEVLVRSYIDQGRWAPTFPLVRDLLDHATTDAELERPLRLLLSVGEHAQTDGNRAEAQHALREAQPWLARAPALAADFEALKRRAQP